MLLSPTDRLARSRERLRQALDGTLATPAAANDPGGRATAPSWLDTLKALPGAAVVAEAIGSWWARHPWRVAAIVAASTASAVVKPLAQRHPLGLMVGAVLVGGLIAWSRPWRWAVKPALFAGLLPQLLLAALRPPPGEPSSGREHPPAA